jgi:hypothetical protein
MDKPIIIKKKKTVTFSRFNQVFIIPNRDQLKLLQYDPLDVNTRKSGRFTIIQLTEDNFEKI